MLNFNAGRRIFLSKAATDMRKSFDTLAQIVREQMDGDPLCGDIFLFLGKRKDRLKALVWDVSGFWLCAKRLEKGRFAAGRPLLEKGSGGRIELSPAELHALLEGIDVHKATYHQQYRHGKR